MEFFCFHGIDTIPHSNILEIPRYIRYLIYMNIELPKSDPLEDYQHMPIDKLIAGGIHQAFNINVSLPDNTNGVLIGYLDMEPTEEKYKVIINGETKYFKLDDLHVVSVTNRKLQ